MFQLLRRSQPLSSEQELARTVGLAFQLAQKTGRPVSLSLDPGPRCLVPQVAHRLRPGVPEGTPLPQGTLDPRWIRAPRPLMVSPWRTATEGMWFLQDEVGLFCMHLQAKGQVRFLRYQKRRRQWVEA